MKKTKIIVYHNTILDKNVYIVVFVNQPLDFERAGNVLKTFSSLKYYAIPKGLNAVTFIERKENFDSLLPTTEEFKISKIMIMSLPDVKSNLYDVRFEDVMKTDEDECSKLELDEKALKSVLRDAGIFNVRIV